MKCRLCQFEHDLVDSHIIPEFLYKPLYHEKRQFFFVLSTDELKKNRILQKGLREKLLCVNCDSALSIYEKHVSEMLFGPDVQTPLWEEDRIFTVNVDYGKFKLFILSLVWRASISTHDFFRAMKLNPVEEERLRTMLIRQDPGKPGDYGVFLVVPLYCAKHPIVDLMWEPDFAVGFNQVIFRFVMAGYVWTICRSRDGSQLPGYSKYYLSEDGKLYVIFMDDNELPMLSGLFEKFRKGGKIQKAVDYLRRI